MVARNIALGYGLTFHTPIIRITVSFHLHPSQSPMRHWGLEERKQRGLKATTFLLSFISFLGGYLPFYLFAFFSSLTK